VHQRGHAHRAGALHDELRALDQEDHRLGGLVVTDRHHFVEPALDERQRQLAGLLDGDPVADRVGRPRADWAVRGKRCHVRCAGLRLHADHARLKDQGLHGHGHAGGEAAAAERHHHEAHLGAVLDDLEPRGALTRDDLRVVERVHHELAIAPGELVGGDARLVEAPFVQLHLSAVLLDGGDLRERRAGGHHRGRGRSDLAGGERDALGMVAGARGHDSRRLLRIGELGELVQSAAHLERAGELQVLGLQDGLCSHSARQLAGAEQRRVPRPSGDPLARGADVVQAEVDA
jgi:hypothetical protein